MAWESGLNPHSFEAAEDMSAKQFSIVNLASDGQVEPCDAGEFVLGILQDKPAAAGRQCSVEATAGRISKVRADGGTVAISQGTMLIAGTDGVAVAESTGGTGYVFGRALAALSTGSTGIISCMLTHEGPQSTA